MPDQTGFIISRFARCAIVGVVAVLLSACATQRYGRMTPVSPGERTALNCEQIALEIEKANFFIEDVRRQRSETTGAHVLGALGDFGIGNVMEGDAAEKSGTDRLRELTSLRSAKGCGSMESAASSSGTAGRSSEPASNAAAASATGPITTREEFYKFVVDRPIVGRNGKENYVLRSDGTMTGTLGNGTKLSGPWYFEDGYFCREVIANYKSYGWDCQVVKLDGNEVAFVRNRGKGEVRKYVFKQEVPPNSSVALGAPDAESPLPQAADEFWQKQAAARAYLKTHEEAVKRDLYEYNRQHRLTQTLGTYNQYVLRETRVLNLVGDDVMVKVSWDYSTRWNARSASKVVRMRWMGPDLKIAGHQ